MKRLRLFLGWSLLVIAALACGGPSQAELNATATSMAAGIFATQTAEAPTDTPTPLPTDTPTPTDTPAPTDTPTSTPADTPEPTEEVQAASGAGEVDISDVVLELEDLPSGFEAFDSAEMGLTKEAMSSGDFKAESVFTFLQPETFEVVLGFTTLLPNRLEQVGFDAGLRDPEMLSGSIIEGMGGAEVLEQEDLAIDDVGDKSAGLSIVTNLEGIPMRLNIVVFRKDAVGAFVTLMHIDGSETTASVEDLARKLAGKIV